MNGDPVLQYILRIQFYRSDGSVWDLDIPDYDQTLGDEAFQEGANAILAENVFAPDGLSLIKIGNIQKIITSKEDIEPAA